MARVAELLGDRWTLLILREAFYGVWRFEDMRADLDAPRAMLTDRLNRLVEAGIMTRTPYQEPGKRSRTGYALTPSGRELALVFLAMTDWAERHLLNGPAPVDTVDRRSGEKLRIAVVDAKDNVRPLSDARLRRRG